PGDGSIGARAQGMVAVKAGGHGLQLAFGVHADAQTAGDGSVIVAPPKGEPPARAGVPPTGGADAASPKIGVDVPVHSPPQQMPAGSTVTPDSPWPYVAAPPDLGVGAPGGIHRRATRPRGAVAHPAAGTTCVTGSFVFVDQNGQHRPAVNLTVSA